MKSLKYSIFIFLICSVFTALQAQEGQKTQSINEGSIIDQFEFVIKKSSNWTDEKGQSYEVIKRNMMLTLKAHTIDSLNAMQARLDSTKKIVGTQQKEINTLKTDLAKTEDSLASTNLEKDSLVFLGIQMSKSNYGLLMWSIIAVLLVLLLLFIYKFKNSNVVTKATKIALVEMEDEFTVHRRNALEREQKVKRQLQDMINKYEG
jgi:hypothetical protein